MMLYPYLAEMMDTIALDNALNELEELKEQLAVAEDMQSNLNYYLGMMPVLSELVEAWQTTEYYEEDNDLVTFHQMLMLAEYHLGVRLSLPKAMQASRFMEQLNLTLSGKLPMRPSRVNRMQDIYDSSYQVFLESYVKRALLEHNYGDEADSLMEESF